MEKRFLTREEEIEMLVTIERINKQSETNPTQKMAEKLANSSDPVARLMAANMQREQGKQATCYLMTQQALVNLARYVNYSGNKETQFGHIFYVLGNAIHVTPNFTEEQHIELTKLFLENLKENLGGDKYEVASEKGENEMVKDELGIRKFVFMWTDEECYNALQKSFQENRKIEKMREKQKHDSGMSR